jgi:hypothetical protein
MSGKVAQALRTLQRQASLEGRGEAVLAAFRTVIEHLQRDPTGCGEPRYRLPALRMEVRSTSIRPLVVHFGVCEDRPLVFIKGVKLLSR